MAAETPWYPFWNRAGCAPERTSPLFSAPSGLNPGWCSPGWSRLRKLSAGSIRRATAGEAFYRKWLGAPTINVGSLEAAELVKLAGMVYRDVNIALANELAGVAECIGLGIWPLIKAANTDGETAMLLPGIGVGGHCTPVYPYFLIDASVDYSGRLRLTSLGRQINEDQPRARWSVWRGRWVGFRESACIS